MDRVIVTALALMFGGCGGGSKTVTTTKVRVKEVQSQEPPSADLPEALSQLRRHVDEEGPRSYTATAWRFRALADAMGAVATCRPIPTCDHRRYESLATKLYRAAKTYGLGTNYPPLPERGG